MVSPEKMRLRAVISSQHEQFQAHRGPWTGGRAGHRKLLLTVGYVYVRKVNGKLVGQLPGHGESALCDNDLE